jgi:hypothetical protein
MTEGVRVEDDGPKISPDLKAERSALVPTTPIAAAAEASGLRDD